MKLRTVVGALVVGWGGMVAAGAQVTITAKDMFNEVGQYYRAYVNADGAAVAAAGLIGEKGGPRLWSFDQGSEAQVFRFDYVDPRNTVIGLDFPDATVAERKTEEVDNSQAYLLFEQVPGLGRKVYGFWDLDFNISNPSVPFESPVIDFPAQINFGDRWSNSITYEINLLAFGFDIPARISTSSEFEVDAWGFLELPEPLGFGDAIRVNQLDVVSTAIDLNGTGQFTNVDTQFVRTYYWLRPGLGIAAQMTSQQGVNPPADNFPLAMFFIRMFETNKEQTPACEVPGAVTDLELSLSGNRALLTWSEADCTREYRVEVRSEGVGQGQWRVLGTTGETFFVDTVTKSDRVRLYRVVSLP